MEKKNVQEKKVHPVHISEKKKEKSSKKNSKMESPTSTYRFFKEKKQPTTAVGYEVYERKEEEILKGINFDKLTRLIENCKERVMPAKDRDLILLVGRTGAGKSTTLNYLMGCPLKTNRKGMKTFLEVANGNPYAEIGHDLTNAKTLYPQVVPMIEFPQLAYLDLPGLRDTHTLEEKLCTSVALPMALHYARSIRGVMLVIDANDLTTGKGEAFVDFLGILGSLLKNPAALNATDGLSQILFVFTKVPADCGIEDILATMQDAKKELFETHQNDEEELNEITKRLAKNVNLLKEWSKANQSGHEEGKIQIRIKILETASQAPFSEKPEIQEINARYKVLGEEIRNTLMQLVGLEFILKQADRLDTLFIIRGNEKDDKQKLLKSITALQAVSPIPKEEFVFRRNKNGEWDRLSQIVQEIAVEGALLLNEQNAFLSEFYQIKKYKKLVEKQRASFKEWLKNLKTSKPEKNKLNELCKEIVDFNEELLNYLSKAQREKQSKKEHLEEELKALDTAEPTLYKHPSLDPVNLETSLTTWFAASLTVGLPLCFLGIAGAIVIGAPSALIGGISGGIATILQASGLNISDKAVSKAGLAPMVPLFLLGAPLEWLGNKFISNTHHFQYNGIPFVRIELKSSSSTANKLPENRSVIHLNKAAQELLPEWYIQIRTFYRGFDLSTEVSHPEQGKYEIVYRNITDTLHEVTAWIDLFVEKRMHPNFSSRIKIIKKELELLEFTMNSYLTDQFKQLKEAMEEEKRVLNCISNKEALQSACCESLEKRLFQYQKNMEILHGCLLGSQYRIVESCQELLRQKPRYVMLKQLSEIMGTSTFTQAFLNDCDNYFTQRQEEYLPVIWGRKQTPDQQPDYEVKHAKVSGQAIGAFFKVHDKPNGSSWLGKLGYQSLFSAHSKEFRMFSRVRRGVSLESVLEKIAADFYQDLSNGEYWVPKTRLAELPIENRFTKEHPLTALLLSEINEGKDRKIHDGVYLMSKRIENYRDLADLNDCILDEKLLSFEQCLEMGKLPEQVKVEGKIVPLKGIMEILAVSRLMADTDALGGGAKNAGFLIERDANGQPTTVRVVKVDPGYAFNFRGTENLFYQSLNPVASPMNVLTQDKRHLQYGNMANPLLWDNLTEAQQNQFVLALDFGLKRLSHIEEILAKFVARKEFEQTPKQRPLPQIIDYFKDLKENLNWQESAYKQELDA